MEKFSHVATHTTANHIDWVACKEVVNGLESGKKNGALCQSAHDSVRGDHASECTHVLALQGMSDEALIKDARICEVSQEEPDLRKFLSPVSKTMGQSS